jgi:hypothetical protein
MGFGNGIAIEHGIGNALQRKSPIASGHIASSRIAGPASRYCLAAALALLVSGCASDSDQSRVADTEQMLVAAGFVEKPANTPARQSQLATLPPYEIQSQQIRAGGTYTVGYVYADPKYCHCLFVGNDRAYERHQRMAVEKKIADERLQAAEMREDASFDWGAWGPYDDWWGPGAVVVVRGRR